MNEENPEKAEIERRRIVERLTTAQFAADSAYQSLLSVGIFNTEAHRLAKISMAKNNAKNLLEQIKTLLRDVQGE